MSNRKEYMKEYHRQWEKNNPERLKAYRKKNSEKKKLYQHQWYLDHREECLEKSKLWVSKNRETYRESCRKRHKGKKQWMNEYKLSKGCAVCGYNKCAVALDFHHNGDKIFDISAVIAGNINLEKIKEEMNKCIVLCANCHRELHSKEENEE